MYVYYIYIYIYLFIHLYNREQIAGRPGNVSLNDLAPYMHTAWTPTKPRSLDCKS